MYKKAFSLFCLMLPACGVMADDNDVIRFNQVGYLPDQEKTIVVDNQQLGKVFVTNEKGKKVATLKPTRQTVSPFTGKKRYVVDMTKVKKPGRYTIHVDGNEAQVEVREHAFHDLAVAAAKAFYLMRSGTAIEQRYAGKFARPLGHPDTQVMVHPSAATPQRPAGTLLSSPLGWYDAGDYNKYIVNSAFTIGIMLSVYEQIPQYFSTFDLNIPESGNSTPDILDEIMFNLKWMLTMQDPDDGGVYHKLTTPNFEGFVMPSDCHQQRYVVKKTVTAALDFAAVMAKAARVYKSSSDYQGFSETALAAARKAYSWAMAHPDVFYRQNEMNRQFKPEVHTGDYDDGSAADERFWAATELYLSTGEDDFLKEARQTKPNQFVVPVWGNVGALGWMAWMSQKDSEMRQQAGQMLREFADNAAAHTAESCFQAPFGDERRNFGWGCLAEGFCAPAVSMLFAEAFVGDQRYRKDALRTLDYILGRNALGYCYVTGFGKKSPQHPHQRLSSADGIAEPMPGLLVGGPNAGQQDKGSGLVYHSSAPDESYLDEEASYASNEIAINWNGCLVALVCWLDALM